MISLELFNDTLPLQVANLFTFVCAQTTNFILRLQGMTSARGRLSILITIAMSTSNTKELLIPSIVYCLPMACHQRGSKDQLDLEDISQRIPSLWLPDGQSPDSQRVNKQSKLFSAAIVPRNEQHEGYQQHCSPVDAINLGIIRWGGFKLVNKLMKHCLTLSIALESANTSLVVLTFSSFKSLKALNEHCVLHIRWAAII